MAPDETKPTNSKSGGRKDAVQPYSGYLQRTPPAPEHHLTEVGPGTPMGEYFRRFWHPICLSEEIGDVPKNIRILGEDLVVFRDKSGSVGLFQPFCCHRGAHLENGIVSERGLRCCYHGWLFDVDGTVLETPGEPPSSTLKDKVFQGAYPATEIKGLVHAYMGPPELKPHPPHYDLFDVPGAAFAPFSTPFPNNWLQSHENNVDPVHTVFLHQRITEQFGEPWAVLPHIVWDVTNNGDGLTHLDGRRLDPETVWIRFVHTLVPGCSFIPSTWELGAAPLYYQRALYMRFTVPTDDENTNVLGWRVHGPGFPGGDAALMGPGRTDMEGQVDRSDTLSHEEMQRTPDDFQAQGTLWGGQTLPFHGAEHLGTSDRGVTLMRKTFRNILDGKVPEAFPKPATEEPDGARPRLNYSFDALVNVKALADEKADFDMIGALGRDMADAAMEVAQSTDDQGLRDQNTKAAIKAVEAAYQAKHQVLR
ncbi:MAG: Rieske 2Fe-2S domain-containing protein [Rhodospirillaceae bacterium]|nr:Rieske 2Fe-2S domain-containing protein [Rhodospirillaceae bacterium]